MQRISSQCESSRVFGLFNSRNLLEQEVIGPNSDAALAQDCALLLAKTGLVGARPTMHVRPMLPSEAECVNALAQTTGFAVDMATELSRSMARVWVAQANPNSNVPDAFLHVWVAADELHIISIGTRPDSRRKGGARALIERLIEYAREVHSRLILLEVRRSNRAALALYRSFGFSVARLRRGYYSAPEEDGIEMIVTLDSEGQLVRLPDEVRNREE